MDRRAFLQPGSLAKSFPAPGEDFSEETDAVRSDQGPTSQDESAAPQLLRFSQKAMGTIFEWVFPYGVADASRLAVDAFALIERLEELLSIYRADSEVSRLNATGHLPDGSRVSQPLWELITQSKALFDLTEGAFDPACGALIKSWGFFKGPFRVPHDDEMASLLGAGGMKQVELLARSQRIFHRTDGVEWNFGAIGKGYAIDCVARWLQSRAGLESFLLHSGRSSIYAKGRSPAEESGWVIQVNHPISDGPLANVRLQEGALATSAATFRKFEHEGKTYGHVLDPRIGYPSNALLSATAHAPQSAMADALSTAVFVAGAELAERLCQDDPRLGFLLLGTEENAPYRVVGKMRDLVLDG